jgi:hypothetical protein
MFNDIFPTTVPLVRDNVEKYCRAGQATEGNIIWDMLRAYRVTKAINLFVTGI